MSLLDIKGLNIDFNIGDNYYPAVTDVSIKVREQEIIGIVGESGSGKSLTAKSILGITPKNARVTYKKLDFKGKDITKELSRKDTKLRGSNISMVFQDSLSSLNPLVRVGDQIKEVLDINNILDKRSRKDLVLQMLSAVGFSNPGEIYKKFPHELSGGMRQRIIICIALIAEPDLILADEPTTALDTTIQKQILDILYSLVREKKKSMILITHDWGVISQMCDYVYVMYAGKIVEEGETKELIHKPKHSYTKALLRALPSVRKKGQELFSIPFKVASITERKAGQWPYIDINDGNRDYIKEYFPEFVGED